MARYEITAIGVYSYFLFLNPMQGQTEGRQQFGPFDTLEQLRAFYKAEMVEPYREEGPNMFSPNGKVVYGKSFRKGGPLEWMNPLYNVMPGQELQVGLDHFGHGVAEGLIDITNIARGQPCNY